MRWHTLLVASLVALLLIAPPFPAPSPASDARSPSGEPSAAGGKASGDKGSGAAKAPVTHPRDTRSADKPVKVAKPATEGKSLEPVNINTADVKGLMSLTGIGRTVAERIVEYRREHGAFKKPGDVRKVQGVGAALFDRNRDRIVVK